MTKKITKPLSNALADHLEVILFCPGVMQKSKKNTAPDQLFDKITHEKTLAESTVFLQLDKALQYSRFMQNNHLIVRAFLPQQAIEGHSHGLAIKKGALTTRHIHGFYCGEKKGALYVENPGFVDPE